MPSTHATIIASVVFVNGFARGFLTPEFSLGLGVLLLFMMDAHGLRRKVGAHARLLNRLQRAEILRERMGHSLPEIFSGLILGAILGYIFA